MTTPCLPSIIVFWQARGYGIVGDLGIQAIDMLAQAAMLKRPPLYARSAAAFWDDSYISEQMLQAHLDPSHDAASRKPETIASTVAWSIQHLGLTPGMHVLDMGCGPGLYCRRFAEAGLCVTGIDYSRRSIDYAMNDAVRDQLPITYRCGNYLQLDEVEAYDVICLIYFDFGALTDDERACLLPRIHRALKPGGRFVFDVRTLVDFAQQVERRNWDLQPHGGFWSPEPYLELKEVLRYPEADTFLCQYGILPETGELRLYRIWERCFAPEGITALLAKHHLNVNSYWADLTGTPWDTGAPGMGVVASKA